MEANIDFSAIDTKQFYEILDGLTEGNDRLNFMKDAKDYNYNFARESQPDAIIQRFYDTDISVVDLIDTFIKCFGEVIICRETSYCEKKYMTIVDTLTDDLYDCITNKDKYYANRIRIILKEAYKQGLLPAIVYIKRDLRKLMTADQLYADFKETH